jgi:hypothetical protein
MDAITKAVYQSDKKKLLDLLRKGADINFIDRGGRTPLMNAVAAGKDEIVELLLKRGADPNVQDKLGFTALHCAAQDYRIAVMKLLLDNGAEVDVQDGYGNTALWRATSNSRGRGDAIKLLLSAGADRTLKNKNGKSPEDVANIVDNFDLKQFFKSSKLEHPVQVRKGRSAQPKPRSSKKRDAPFMEHPTGKFANALAAMTSAIERLHELEAWDRWITFCGQGQGHRADSYHVGKLHLLGDTIDVGIGKIDVPAVLKAGGLREGEVQILIEANGRLRVAGATANQMARVLDGLFRSQLGVRNFEDDGDYAVGTEWRDDAG